MTGILKEIRDAVYQAKLDRTFDDDFVIQMPEARRGELGDALLALAPELYPTTEEGWMFLGARIVFRKEDTA